MAYEYLILDQSNNEIIDPDLTLGYLKKEYFTIHHESIPEQWHYKVVSFDFSNGEIYRVESEFDPHIEIIDNKKGIFNYKNLDGEVKRNPIGQTIVPVQDSPEVPAWDEVKTIYRYILYTEQELIERNFLATGPSLLIEAQNTINSLLSTVTEAQETIDDLLLVLAELIGGEDYDEEPIDSEEENSESELEDPNEFESENTDESENTEELEEN